MKFSKSPNLSLNVYAIKTSVLHRRQIAFDTDLDSVTLGVLYCFDLGEAEGPKVDLLLETGLASLPVQLVYHLPFMWPRYP